MRLNAPIILVTAICVGFNALSAGDGVPVSPTGLEFVLTAPKDPVEIGQTALVHVHLENRSGRSYEIRPAGTYKAFHLTLRGADGRVVPYKERGHLMLGGSVFGPEEFPPGAAFDDDEDLSKLFVPPAPGIYTISGFRDVEGYAPVEAQPVMIIFRAATHR